MNRPRILIIDDDEAICREVVSALDEQGFCASWTTSPTSVVADDCGTPDIVVLDLAMPRTDGFEVIEALSRARITPHLVIASGHGGRIIKAAIRSADRLGVSVLGALEKPYSIRELTTLLNCVWQADTHVAQNDASTVRRLVEGGTLLEHVRVAFQTKRQLSDNGIVGHEALLRITVGGPLNPEIVFAEAVALSVQLQVTEVVMGRAIHFASTLLAAGRPEPVSVNCSPALICAPQFMPMLSSLLKTWELPPKLLVIELTEHHSLETFDAIAAATSRLALHGCGVAVDDFGRGATSFERLLELPLNELKIDKEIFWQCVDGSAARPMLDEVIRFCRSHGIDVTIEGIETDRHRAIARDLGANFGQGFLWGRPEIPDQKSAEGLKIEERG